MDKNFLNIGESIIGRLALDRYLEKTALFWENDQGDSREFSYKEIYNLSNQFANILVENGFKPGNKIFFYLPRIPEIYYGVIGAFKAGGVVGTLFPALGTPALKERLANSQAEFVVTDSDLYLRLQPVITELPFLKHVIVIDSKYFRLLKKQSENFLPIRRKLTDPAIILFTSATGNTPVSGIILPQSSFLQQYSTGQSVLNLDGQDNYWCTADPGWVTGLVYGLIVPLSIGNSILVYEGRFDAQKWLNLLNKYNINVWYTAPTALRMLKAQEDEFKHFSAKSLRRIYSVGEALPPDTANWVNQFFKVPIYDTWWQTECGAMMICNRPGLPVKPGSMGKPITKIKVAITDDRGNKLPINKIGHLVIKPPWPSMMSGIWNNAKLYQSYFHHGWYFSGDLAYCDEDGYYWFVGRDNDVIKTAGERVGPFEVESALNSHPSVLESAVIGKPDALRGQIIKAYVVLRQKDKPSNDLTQNIQLFVKKQLAGHAYPREIEYLDKLPKNRSGKIVRRILRNRELGLPEGDSSTLED